jgi:SpoVK/Ycf46/Vps4 family AAA+-type ATPase
MLRQSLAKPGRPRNVSFCFYGPPGTGKSAFAIALAEAMEMEPLLQRASDLQSKWIGGTEKNLAAAFARAREDDQFLIIDEAEPFLWNRNDATRSWEVSAVNEMLVQMESHTLPLACTTNLLDTIDPAGLRRFAFKIKFDFMRPAQVEAAYRKFFRREAPPALKEMTTLTPSDFASVGKRLQWLGDASVSDAKLLDLLQAEVSMKRLPARRIGF